MMERPIIFSTEMVKAILDGRKTQTRRVVDFGHFLNSCKHFKDNYKFEKMFWDDRKNRNVAIWEYKPESDKHGFTEWIPCPYGQVGDRLWVKEAWCTGDGMNRENDPTKPTYKADWPDVEHGGWKPSIHMPRWASRITLEITEVRVERLRGISEEDAVREGIKPPEHAFRMISGGDVEVNESPQELFAELWDSLNAKRGYGWEANPWVWVINFKKVE